MNVLSECKNPWSSTEYCHQDSLVWHFARWQLDQQVNTNLFFRLKWSAVLPAQSLEKWTVWQVTTLRNFVTSGLYIHQLAAITIVMTQSPYGFGSFGCRAWCVMVWHEDGAHQQRGRCKCLHCRCKYRPAPIRQRWLQHSFLQYSLPCFS